ncbi:PulJ/GspJ family protein [Cellulomonas sp.]|uniref:PulJ/GspJ family protein n=1 Tax=Cellulomonas sp. TaxID=40001 RepID=UPI003BACB40E
MAGLRRRLPRDERGTSLTELLITMLVFTVVIMATAALSIGFARTNAQNISRQDQIDSGRVASEAMSKTLRTAVMPSQLALTCAGCTADAFVVGQDYSVQFYANVDNNGNLVGPSRVTYSIDTSGANAGKLIEKIQVPDSAVPSPAGYVYCDAEVTGAPAVCKARLKTRVVASGIQTSTGTPVFSYYDWSGVRLNPATTGGSLPSASLAHVLAIELVVSVQAPNATKARPTTYIQRLTLPNAQAVMMQQQEN